MARKKINFQVSPGTGVTGYWLAVADKDVPLANGKGSTTTESPSNPILSWWFAGNPGSKLGIVGKVGADKVVEVKGSKIPAGEAEGAGSKRFAV